MAPPGFQPIPAPEGDAARQFIPLGQMRGERIKIAMEGNLHFEALIVDVDERTKTAMSHVRGKRDRTPILVIGKQRSIAAARNFDI